MYMKPFSMYIYMHIRVHVCKEYIYKYKYIYIYIYICLKDGVVSDVENNTKIVKNAGTTYDRFLK
jgi:hypothetical protein